MNILRTTLVIGKTVLIIGRFFEVNDGRLRHKRCLWKELDRLRSTSVKIPWPVDKTILYLHSSVKCKHNIPGIKTRLILANVQESWRGIYG